MRMRTPPSWIIVECYFVHQSRVPVTGADLGGYLATPECSTQAIVKLTHVNSMDLTARGQNVQVRAEEAII